MNKMIRRLLLLCSGVMLQTAVFAQEKPEMADVMRSNGKIYVVVAVCLTILLGLFFYVYIIDRKVSRMEKEH